MPHPFSVFMHTISFEELEPLLKALNRAQLELADKAEPETQILRDQIQRLVQAAGRQHPAWQVGSVITNTLDTESLIIRFFPLLLEVNQEAGEWLQDRYWELRDVRESGGERVPVSWWNSEEAVELCVRLQDALHEAAPPGYVFSAHPSDARNFGFWPEWIF